MAVKQKTEKIFRSLEFHLDRGACDILVGIKEHLSKLPLDEVWNLIFVLKMKDTESIDQLAVQMWAIKKGRCLQAYKIETERPG